LGGNNDIVYATDDDVGLGGVNTGDVIKGSGDTVEVGGSGNSFSASDDIISYLVSGATATLTGNNDTITELANSNDRIDLSGSSDTVAAVSGDNVIELFGVGTRATVDGGATTTGGGIAMTGSNERVTLGAAGMHVGIGSGTGEAISGSGDTIVLNTGVTAAVSGNNNIISLIGGNGITVFGVGESYSYRSTSGASIVGAAAGTSTGAVNFGPGLNDEDLWFVKAGDNLQIDVMGTANHLTINDWFGGTNAAAVQSFTADGLTLDTKVNALVQAMATYSVDHPGFEPTALSKAPSDTTLQSVITAAWHQ
jgi:hypothetical protein